jgi:hypothetical protein
MNETCGCCDGIEQLTPITIINRPGLNALVYRVGTHASFLETMKARLSNLGIPKSDLDILLARADDEGKLIYPLQGLTTRAADDPSIAFLDAWAIVADVLTFYQERIANEGYLRTATERRSILELARLVGYVLRSGVAATVYLAYTLEKDHDVTVLPGNRAQSVPDPGQLPQSFETAENLEARFVWNALKPRLTRPQFISLKLDLASPPDSPPQSHTINTNTTYLQGTAVNLKQGDPLLFVFNDSVPEAMPPFDEPPFSFVKISSVEVQAAENRTKITLDIGIVQQKPTRTAMMAMFPMGAPLEKGTDTSGKVSFTSVVQSLTRPPSLQPPTSQKLKRKAADIFGRQSDMQQQLLVNFSPVLQQTLYSALGNAQVTQPSSQPLHSIQALRLKAAPFGHNMPLPQPSSPPSSPPGDEIFMIALRLGTRLDDPTRLLALDAEYKITKKSWVVVERRGEEPRPFRVEDVQTVTLGGPQAGDLSFFSTEKPTTTSSTIASRGRPTTTITTTSDPIKVRVTLLRLDAPWREPDEDPGSVLPNTTVYAQSELLTPAEEPLDEPIGPNPNISKRSPTNPEEGRVIELATLEAGLKAGRRVIISGERTDVFQADGTTPIRGIIASELVMLASVTQGVGKIDGTKLDLPGDKTHTFLHLAEKLAYTYRRDTVTIYANVVRATHGETRAETLGSGDGSKALQSFTLKQFPLTYLAAPTPAGVESTLQVRVNDILWHELDSLVEAGPTSRNYVTETDDASKTTVVFGNGQYGARLPTGVENIKGVYRTGIGKPGNVRAGQITLLATKPLGVKAVTNPLRASGGADRESRDQARRNVPVALLALDRLVSVQDYADFARTFAGIGKASVTRLPDGRRQLVHLSIVGADNIPIDITTDLYRNLVQALRQFGDPNVLLQVDPCEVLLIVISAQVRLLQDYQIDSVEPKIRATLLDYFSFDNRELGQPVFQSEVFSVIQAVTGVANVDLEIMDAVDEDKVLKVLDTSSADETGEVGSPPDMMSPPDTAVGDGGTANQAVDLVNDLGLGNQTFIDVKLARVDLTATDPARRILPAQLAFLSPAVPDTLIIKELSK